MDLNRLYYKDAYLKEFKDLTNKLVKVKLIDIAGEETMYGELM